MSTFYCGRAYRIRSRVPLDDEVVSSKCDRVSAFFLIAGSSAVSPGGTSSRVPSFLSTFVLSLSLAAFFVTRRLVPWREAAPRHATHESSPFWKLLPAVDRRRAFQQLTLSFRADSRSRKSNACCEKAPPWVQVIQFAASVV